MRLTSTMEKLLLHILISICLLRLNECTMNCSNTSQCTCYSPFLDRYEYHCPPYSYDRGGYVIHVRDNERLRLDCYNLSEFNTNLLPQWYNLRIKFIEIRFAPLPQTNFKEILKKFTELESIENFAFRFSTLTSLPLKQQHFDGLEHLKILDLSSNDFINLDEDVFDKMTNLIYLNLEKNQIVLKTKLFKNLTNLRRLDLANNQLDRIPEGFFDNLTQLRSLNLWYNNLTELKTNNFHRLVNLLSLDLYANRLERIDNDTFVTLINLKNLSLDSNNLTELPIDLFSNNLELELLKIGNNPFGNLPEELFRNLTKLKILDLTNCSLNYLPKTLFENFHQIEEIYLNHNNIQTVNPLPLLQQLRTLNLRNNLIETIKNDIFKQLHNLQDLDLSRNRIKSIEIDSFSKNRRLIKINLSHNNYTLNIQNDNPFGICENLEELDLSFNQIKYVDSLLVATMLKLKKLNLRYNQIDQVSIDLFLTPSSENVFMDLSYNKIETVSFDLDLNLNDSTAINDRIYTTINFKNNPFKCDCRMDSVWKYFQNKIDPSIKYSININEDDFICTNPIDFRNVSIKALKPYMLVCPLNEILPNYCPDNCQCDWRSIDQTIIIDCTERNLQQWPQLTVVKDLQFNEIEMHLENNRLIDTPFVEINGYENITKLYVSKNRIENINWLPTNLKILDLRNNSINRVDGAILEKFKRIRNISLDYNPWICDCSTVDFANFLRSNLNKISPNNIQCKGDNSRLVDLNKNDLCKMKIIVIYSSVCGLTVCLILAIIAVFYYRHQQEIKIWLYARNCCLWWVTEEEVDKDKLYDAFISYSNQDETFVMENLVPVLESGPSPYKLCLHKRNWTPGEFITKQIINSVNDSRRTIIVLSTNFIASQWGKMEFRTAHTKAMNEKRVRVIVILLGDVDIDKLDDEMKAYLKTNTYVQWGNPHFWDQLRYALPHRSRTIKTNNFTNREKHMRTMLKIDEKFNLTPTFTTNPESTPPVTSLDTSLLRKHPLNLTNPNEQITTPAEC